MRNSKDVLKLGARIAATVFAVAATAWTEAQPAHIASERQVPPEPIYSNSETEFFTPPPGNYIIPRLSFAVIDHPGDYVQTAQCLSGEQLLGGGYLNGDSAPFGYAINVKANYPSSDSAWTASFHLTPAAWAPEIDPLNHVFVVAYAYCLDAPGYPLDLVTVSADNSQLPKVEINDTSGNNIDTRQVYQGVPQSWSVSCPSGSVLTGGGFAIDGPDQATDAIHNTDLIASLPTVRADGIAEGWKLSLVAFHPDTVRLVRAYARCATRGLKALPAAQLSQDLTPGYAAGEHELNAMCSGGGITTAGGAEPHADWLIPHLIFSSRGNAGFGSWQMTLFGAYQPANYPHSRPCTPSTETCLEGEVIASCYAPPDLPYITVRIISPPDSYHFPTNTPGGADTDPIVLTAKVFDKGGNVLPQATVKWIYTPLAPGAPAQELGTGNPLIVTLPAGATMSWGWIRADASVQVGPGIDRSAILDKRNPKAVVSRLGTGDPRKTLVKGPPVPSYVLKAHASIKVETGTVL